MFAVIAPVLVSLLGMGACAVQEKGEPPAEAVAVSELSASVSDEVATMILARWTQEGPARVWVEFEWGGVGYQSPAVDGESGENEAWMLGVAADTDVTWRVVTDNEGEGFVSEDMTARTGSLPEDLRVPELAVWEPGLAGEGAAGWVLGSVDVDGGSPYSGPFWLFIADRAGNIVWYRDLEYWQSMFPRVARDGSHIAYDSQYLLDPGGALSMVNRTTLDGRYSEAVPTPGLGWCWDETGDGAVLYDRYKDTDGVATIEEVGPDGSQRTVWECTSWQAPLDEDPDHCYTNTINWVEATDSVLWSTYWGDYALEVDRQSGEVLWYAGLLDGGWSFEPDDAVFDLQHYPNYTPDGTLLISTHVPGVEGTQRAREYEVDYASETLRQVWEYGEGVDQWARYSGEAVRLESGNTLINYGTGGELREVTAEGALAWSLQFGDEHTLGHTELIADLYAVNAGP